MESQGAVSVVRVIATVRGRVQGVGYRDFVHTVARRYGCTGYVCNSAERSRVDVVVEGRREALDELLQALHRGPCAARVEQVSVLWDQATGEFERFNIRY